MRGKSSELRFRSAAEETCRIYCFNPRTTTSTTPPPPPSVCEDAFFLADAPPCGELTELQCTAACSLFHVVVVNVAFYSEGESHPGIDTSMP